VAFIDSRGQPLHTNLPTPPNVGVAALAWAPDGRRLASASANQGCWIIEPNAAQPFRKVATKGDIVLFERE
jgi:hypothetical protein